MGHQLRADPDHPAHTCNSQQLGHTAVKVLQIGIGVVHQITDNDHSLTIWGNSPFHEIKRRSKRIEIAGVVVMDKQTAIDTLNDFKACANGRK